MKSRSIVLLATMIITVFVHHPRDGIAGMNPVPTDIADQIKWSTV